MPGNAIVVVDPDRYPTAGGLAVVREGDVAAVSYTPDADPAATLATYRIVAVTVDRDGRMFGYSTAPAIEIALQDRPSEHLGAIVSAHFS